MNKDYESELGPIPLVSL